MRFIISCSILAMCLACTPKLIVDQEVEKTPVETEQKERPTVCGMFSDAPDRNEARKNHVLYRDFFKANDFNESFKYWQLAYEMAPAADGSRDYHFTDGVKLYQHFYKQTNDKALKDQYWDKISMLYNEARRCFPHRTADYHGYEAFDLYYNFPERATKLEIYQKFNLAIDRFGSQSPAYILNPYTDLLISLLREGKIDIEEAKKYTDLVNRSLDYGLSNYTGTKKEAFDIVNSYVPSRMEDLETVRGFYDCDYYVNKYYSEFEAKPTDCDVMNMVFSRLKWGNCSEERQEYKNLVAAYNKNCRQQKGSPGYDCLKNADYACAIKHFEEEADKADDPIKKSKYLLLVSKIYYTHLKNFSKARAKALEAANARPNWGEPYLLIGRLYASSGPLCGPGTGWESQVVVWPAIDMWQKAKSVDKAAAPEANQFINRYLQYMPSNEDIFFRTDVKEGDSYYVACWIQRSTTVRAAK